MNALTTAGNGAEKPSSQSARNVAQRSRLVGRTLLFAGVFALLAMIYVPTPARQYQSAHYRFIFDQHETGIAFFQLLVNVAFAALAGVLVAHAFRVIAKIPKRVIVAAICIIAVAAGFALRVNYYRLKADSEQQLGLYLHAAADYDRALFFGDLAGKCRREQAQMDDFYFEQQRQAATPVIDFSRLPDQSPTSPIPDWAKSPPDWVKSALKKSDDAQEKKQKRSAAVPSPATTPAPTAH